jgi:hypothetical protein
LATTESGIVGVNEEDAVNVNVAIPKASVVAVPLLPESGPVILKATLVPTAGSPFDKTTAVSVMEEPEPHMIEEFTGESTMDDPGTGHPLVMVSLPLIVTAPVLASARPFRVPPFNVMLVRARIFPTKSLFTSMVAEEPTCQNTLQGDTPIKDTLELVPVIRVLTILKINTSLDPPLSVRVPVNPADDVKQ